MGFPLAGPGLPGVFDASVNPANPNATYIRMLLHRLERVMGFAPTASSLARKRSTAELHPHIFSWGPCRCGAQRSEHASVGLKGNAS